MTTDNGHDDGKKTMTMGNGHDDRKKPCQQIMAMKAENACYYSQSLRNCDSNLRLPIPNALRAWANAVLLGFLHEKTHAKTPRTRRL
jgi:hypothetical protein